MLNHGQRLKRRSNVRIKLVRLKHRDNVRSKLVRPKHKGNVRSKLVRLKHRDNVRKPSTLQQTRNFSSNMRRKIAP